MNAIQIIGLFILSSMLILYCSTTQHPAILLYCVLGLILMCWSTPQTPAT